MVRCGESSPSTQPCVRAGQVRYRSIALGLDVKPQAQHWHHTITIIHGGARVLPCLCSATSIPEGVREDMKQLLEAKGITGEEPSVVIPPFPATFRLELV